MTSTRTTVKRVKAALFSAAAVGVVLSGTFAHGQANGDIRVTFTNEGSADGFFLTPLWFAFQDGNTPSVGPVFDLFDVGGNATAGLELLAEEGDVSGLTSEFAASGVPGNLQGVVTGPAGFGSGAGQPPVIDPGETGTAFITPINPANYQYLTFASMLIPSNDAFIGNEDPGQYQVFDSSGQLIDPDGDGRVTFIIPVADIFDAGTEVNNTLGAAFSAVGGVASDEGGTVSVGPDLSNFLGTSTAAGTTIGDLFTGNEVVATITVSIVPEPGVAALLVGPGLMLLRRRRMNA